MKIGIKIKQKQRMVSKPEWLNTIEVGRDIIYKGYAVKRIPLQNWDKFILYMLPASLSQGQISYIEVCNTWIIYHFKKYEDIEIERADEIFRQAQDLCRSAGKALEELGFELDLLNYGTVQEAK